jgi:hypothetical protein
MIAIALGLAYAIRLRWWAIPLSWYNSWQRSLFLFLFPFLLIVMTAASIVCMGASGQMFGLWAGWFSYSCALGFLGWVVIVFFHQAIAGARLVREIRTYPVIKIGDKSCRVPDIQALFAAQIGFWQPELVLSQSLLNRLDSAHLEAVITHEEAHYYYRDTFWFFWLGWVRKLTNWLPNTENIWQELLCLRELRADRWSAQKIDPLLLAESLLLVMDLPSVSESILCAGLSCVAPPNQLTQRLEALLAQSFESDGSACQRNLTTEVYQPRLGFWISFAGAFSPLAAIPFHV